ncbi:hypothetical protein [Peribacillus frigoritolerans]|uniref:Uncharacterized protein n=1 Tax=Peribacillus frigoritolerans TaxID=450367 RepID=A0AAJ1QPD9_9BACI|nr:hypothetical protein [Peribacillus frigoritolerans]MDM5284689.1 hypothetical protein [Peribacillus frigoritolerans]
MNDINQIMKTLSHPEKIAFTTLIKNYSKDVENLIIFIVPSADLVGGGILSIYSLYEESRKLTHIHGSKVLMCTLPKDAILLKNTRFENDVPIYPFDLIPKYFSKLRKCIFHIPEIFVGIFKFFMADYYSYLSALPDLQINILNQNIELMPDVHVINELKKFTVNITCTTAHERYTTRELREAIGIPLHKFSTFISPEQYKSLDYIHKENLMVVSPDDHPLKSNIIDLIKRNFPAINIVIIQDLTYEDYKELISRAKWALTFGEGLDGYFIETVFSGGISFSAYNDKFFTSEFKNLKTVYLNYDQLVNEICNDLKNLDNEHNFKQYQKEQLFIIKKYYDYKEYVKNVERFYKKKYTFR